MRLQIRRWAILIACIAMLSAARAEDLFFDSDGVKIHYVVRGEGEPVLLIHGYSASIPTQWGSPGIITALAQEYKVIALDNRGHGMSGKPHAPEAYGVQMVGDAVRLLDHLKIEKAHVVGYSMGGFITMKLLAMHPERVISATPAGSGWAREGDARLDVIDRLADSLEKGEGFGPLIEGLTPPGQPVPPPERVAGMSQLMSVMNDVKALAACARGMKQLFVEEETLRKNAVPTLAIMGEVDPLKASLDPMIGVMSNLEVVVIEGADHMNAFGNPKFIGTLKDFLNRHATKKPSTVGE